MELIRRVVRVAWWRLFAADLLRTLSLMAVVALGGVLVARIVERSLGLQSVFAPRWATIGIGSGAGVVVFALAWAWWKRRDALTAARVLDEKAGLKESLSTALCVEKTPDPWARAVIETAETKARGVQVARAMPIEIPRSLYVALCTAAGALIVWMAFPNLDLLGRVKKQQEQQARQTQALAVQNDLKDKQKKLEELLKNVKVDFQKDDAGKEGEGSKANEIDPEAMRRAAVKQLTDLTDKLQNLKSGESAAKLESLKESLKQLKPPAPGPMDDFAKSLARGDFNKAGEALEQLNKQLAEGQLSPEDRSKLQAQAKDLGEQLKKAADKKDDIQKKLEQAGLDKKAASELAQKAAANPDAIKQALEKLNNLTPEQLQGLMKMAQAAAQNAEQMEKMSNELSQMAQGMQGQQMDQQAQEGMQQLQQQLSNMELAQSDLQNLDAALNEAKDQLSEMCKRMGDGEGDKEGQCDGQGIGEWRAGTNRNAGKGSGGPGRGMGARGEDTPADYTIEKKKTNTKTGKGPIIGSRLVQGAQVKGEASAEFSEVTQAASKEASEAIENNMVRRELEGVVKHYFGTLEKSGKEGKTPSAPPAPLAPAAPAAGDPKK